VCGDSCLTAQAEPLAAWLTPDHATLDTLHKVKKNLIMKTKMTLKDLSDSCLSDIYSQLKHICDANSVADPDFYSSRIPQQQQKRGLKKNFCHTLFCSHKFHKKF
jgi:hypothetical protein